MNSELILKLILKEEGRIDELEKERTQNLETIQRQTKEIDELRESLNKTQLELGEEKKTAQQPHPNVMNRIKTQLEYIRKLEDEAAKNEEEIQWLKEDDNRQQRRLEYIRELKDELAKKDETIQTLKYGRNVLAAEKTIQKWTKEKEDLAGQLEIVKGKNEQMGRIMSEQQAALIEMTERNEALQAALDKLQERIGLQGAAVMQQNEISADSKDIEVQTEVAALLKKRMESVWPLEETTRQQLAEAQERVKFLEDKYVPVVISLSEEKAELEKKLKAAQEEINELEKRSYINLRHKLTGEEKVIREECVKKLADGFIAEYANAIMHKNDKPLEEEAKEMAEKTVQIRELNQEVLHWRVEMSAKLQNNFICGNNWIPHDWEVIYLP